MFIAQGELAAVGGASAHRIAERHVLRLESEIDRLSEGLEPLRSFVLPRGTTAAADLHIARTVARRAERELWHLHESEPVSAELLQWANRLSDLLFALALSVNHSSRHREIPPDYTV